MGVLVSGMGVGYLSKRWKRSSSDGSMGSEGVINGNHGVWGSFMKPFGINDCVIMNICKWSLERHKHRLRLTKVCYAFTKRKREMHRITCKFESHAGGGHVFLRGKKEKSSELMRE